MVFPESGQAVCWVGTWQARWDLSPLGYLKTASHGHLDALHLSLWLGGTALVVDPGTGAYYGDVRLRAWLASWAAHNGPHVPDQDVPRRVGPFLWGESHAKPEWRVVDATALAGSLALPQGTAHREVRRLSGDGGDGWQVDDRFEFPPGQGGQGFRVCWQFGPGTRLDADPQNPRWFHGRRRGTAFLVRLGDAWSGVQMVSETAAASRLPISGDLVGLCAPAFRWIEAGPVLILTATAQATSSEPCRTTFLVEPSGLSGAPR